MPVEFDEYQGRSEDIDWAIDPSSTAYRILAFLSQYPETGFTPREIHERTEIARDSIGTTLRRLADRGLVRHKEPYWAVDPDGLEAYESVEVSHEQAETSTTYDWGDEHPEDYRIGLAAVTEDARDDRD